MIIHPRDNVEIHGDGHKYARRAIRAGENVIKYGMPIGHATCDIAPGEHVHVHNVATNLGETLEYAYDPDPVVVGTDKDSKRTTASGDVPTFKGYRHPDGRVGVRNDIWIIPTVGCVNNLCERLAASCGGIAVAYSWWLLAAKTTRSNRLRSALATWRRSIFAFCARRILVMNMRAV